MTMKTFKKFVECYEPVNEAEYNAEWWDSKSDNFKKRYIERHPNSIYAQKANTSSRDDESPAMRAAKSASNIMNRVKLGIGDIKNKVPNEKKAPKEQPADEWVDDAFDEANMHFKWQKAKDRMSYHGVDEFTIRDIIKSGNYEPEEIIDALNSSNHHQIDAMRDSVKKQEEN